jgi:hypothetical protein
MLNATECALLVVCAWCKSQRDPEDPGRWLTPPSTPEKHPTTHSICPACREAILDDICKGDLLRHHSVK